VLVQGLAAGRLEGFRFRPQAALREEARGLLAAANRGLRAGIREQVRACEAAPDSAFGLSPEGRIGWRGGTVGRLLPGDSAASPVVEALPSELLDPTLRESVRRRLAAFVERLLERGLHPLLALREAPLLGAARGLAFSLIEGLGTAPRREVGELQRSLAPEDRRRLSRLGVTLGRQSAFLATLLRPEVIRLRVSLAAARHGLPQGPLPDGAPSLPAPAGGSPFYTACGYLAVGPRLLRADVLQRFAVEVSRATSRGPFRPEPAAVARLGSPPEDVPGVLRALGYVERGGGLFSYARGEGRRAQARRA
jgi:ATP-dependent RNA helicase SUPV3L1/SUV3